MGFLMPQTENQRTWEAEEYEPHEPCGHLPKPDTCLKCLRWRIDNDMADAMCPLYAKMDAYGAEIKAMEADPTRPPLMIEDYWTPRNKEQLIEEVEKLHRLVITTRESVLTIHRETRDRLEWEARRMERPERLPFITDPEDELPSPRVPPPPLPSRASPQSDQLPGMSTQDEIASMWERYGQLPSWGSLPLWQFDE